MDRSVINSSKELIDIAFNIPPNVHLGKSNFDIEGLVIDKPTIIEGVDKNDTILKIKNLIIASENIILKNMTIEADLIIFEVPIEKVINVSFYSKDYYNFFPSKLIKLQENSYVKIEKFNNERRNQFFLTNKELEDKFAGIVIIKESNVSIEEDLIVEKKTFYFLDCNVIFKNNGGIAVKDGRFVAYKSIFKSVEESMSYKNITLVGKTKGHIKDCKFLNLKNGRQGEEITPLVNKEYGEGGTYGGALFVFLEERNYQICNCEFNNCSAEFGGGIYIKKNIEIENCKFNNCAAELEDYGYGGGIYAEGNNIIKNCEFNNCYSRIELGGGGIYAEKNNTIENCRFNECSTISNGGGIFIYENNIVKNCEFNNCYSSYGNGGGVYAEKSNIIENCKFDKCSAMDYCGPGSGGGIYAEENNIIKGCKFYNCFSIQGGGICTIKNNTIENCKFDECSAKDDCESSGGGIFAEEGNIIKNCEFSNCSAVYDDIYVPCLCHKGGAICAGGNNKIKNCKFENCFVKGDGGGICVKENNIIENCKFDNCHSEMYGGGICAGEGSKIKNCEFNGCYADCEGNKAIIKYVYID